MYVCLEPNIAKLQTWNTNKCTIYIQRLCMEKICIKTECKLDNYWQQQECIRETREQIAKA